MSDRIDATTGEILDDGDPRGVDALAVIAADQLPVAKRSGYLSDVMRMLEDGQFNADVSDAMRALGIKLEAHAARNKGQAKGEITMSFKFHVANGVFVITPDFKVKEPVEKRGGTALFFAENGSLGKNPPGQRPMFGDRAPRDDYDGPGSEPRTV